MNDPFDLLQDTKSYIIGDIKRNQDVNILLQDFTSKKTNRKCLPLTKYTENTGPEMIFSGFKKNIKKYEFGKNQSGDSVEQDINLVWPYCFVFSWVFFWGGDAH
jgi:hypothetical protein